MEFTGFTPSAPSNSGPPLPKPARPLYPQRSKKKGKRGKKKSYKANRELKSFISEETMLAIVHELSASNRMMAAALSEIARAKEIPPAPVEVTDFYVDGEEMFYAED